MNLIRLDSRNKKITLFYDYLPVTGRLGTILNKTISVFYKIKKIYAII